MMVNSQQLVSVTMLNEQNGEGLSRMPCEPSSEIESQAHRRSEPLL